jgi:hypothetical protein
VRQPTGQRAIGFDFVQWSVGAHRMGDHHFFAVCWGHASPFNWHVMNVVSGGAEIRPRVAWAKPFSNQSVVESLMAFGPFDSARLSLQLWYFARH